MAQKLVIPKITKDERIWLKEVYDNNYEGNIISIKDLWGKLHDKLPKSYRPESMNSQLISKNGEEIRVMGVIALQKNKNFLKRIDTVINCIQQIILADTKIQDIDLTDVEQRIKLPIKEISMILRLTGDYSHFYKGAAGIHNSLQLKSIHLGNERDVFYNYKEFPGIENLILLKNSEEEYEKEEKFNYKERIALDKKLDNLGKEIFDLKLGQEIILADVMKELDELKSLYNLSKKNWRQIFFGKLTEMVMSGVVSETASKKIVELIIPQIKKLLN